MNEQPPAEDLSQTVPEAWDEKARDIAEVRARQRGFSTGKGKPLLFKLILGALILGICGMLAYIFGGFDLVMIAALIGGGGFIYFLPSFVASSQGHRNVSGIFLINLFLGWTLIGWVGALVWAVYQEKN